MRIHVKSLGLAACLSAAVLAGCHSSAKPVTPAAKAAAPATAAEPKECETDADCKDGKHCILEQVRDDPSNYDPNATDGPNSAPVMEESHYCE
jgi:hypothetical protein